MRWHPTPADVNPDGTTVQQWLIASEDEEEVGSSITLSLLLPLFLSSPPLMQSVELAESLYNDFTSGFLWNIRRWKWTYLQPLWWWCCYSPLPYWVTSSGIPFQPGTCGGLSGTCYIAGYNLHWYIFYLLKASRKWITFLHFLWTWKCRTSGLIYREWRTKENLHLHHPFKSKMDALHICSWREYGRSAVSSCFLSLFLIVQTWSI